MKHPFHVNIDFVENWIEEELDERSQARLLHVLETFAELGPLKGSEQLPRNRIKFLFDGIYEIRIEQYRIAYF